MLRLLFLQGVVDGVVVVEAVAVGSDDGKCDWVGRNEASVVRVVRVVRLASVVLRGMLEMAVVADVLFVTVEIKYSGRVERDAQTRK